uniref:Lipocalin/cytosolic fatty-acid binding domain-containing protein n=1 Tax=Oryctolagus cuniculus TaxID=9986 RepID=U3KMM7_RABIT
MLFGLLDDSLQARKNRQRKTYHNTIYLAANNEKMISENGPLRIYLRNIQGTYNGDLEITFYTRTNCTCQKFTCKAVKTEDIWFSMTYWGRNYLHVTRNKGAMGLVFLINVSEDGDVTSVLVGTGPGSDLTPEDFEIFKSKLRSLRMPLKNIIKVTETDTCPRD